MNLTPPRRPVNRVKAKRLARRWTQAELAEQAGISRTAVTAIEADSLSPSVAAALALARALETTVEELFGACPSECEKIWAWAPSSSGVERAWQAEVNGRQILYPATTSLLLAELPDWIDGQPYRRHDPLPVSTLVIATCDPAAGLLARCYAEATGMRMLVLPRSSTQSLEMLQRGLVHLAGVHLSTREDPLGNELAAQAVLEQPFQWLRLANWQGGIAVSPKSQMRSVRSALRSKLSWVGRGLDSAAGLCLKRLFDGRPLPRRKAHSHRGVAEAIQAGWADAGICTELVAQEQGLDFLPVQEEAYEVCYSPKLEDDRRFGALLNVARSPAYRQLLDALPGYDTSETGTLSGAGPAASVI